ncbi:hypothetical protein GCM10009789_40610 [Kribbella sancticallisti]|uniref:Uncharacterized protein n=1 Tax=Kribbella sancticallisti TaxID=460087 RepID=A0ABP4PNK5_9ACTN
MQAALLGPRLLVIHRVGAEAGLHILDSPHAIECMPTDLRPFAPVHRHPAPALAVDNFRDADADSGNL